MLPNEEPLMSPKRLRFRFFEFVLKPCVMRMRFRDERPAGSWRRCTSSVEEGLFHQRLPHEPLEDARADGRHMDRSDVRVFCVHRSPGSHPQRKRWSRCCHRANDCPELRRHVDQPGPRGLGSTKRLRISSAEARRLSRTARYARRLAWASCRVASPAQRSIRQRRSRRKNCRKLSQL